MKDPHRQAQTPPPIVQYWHAKEPPDYVRELVASFDALNPGLDHLLFDESSAAELIGSRFGRRQLRAFEACAVPAMQADYLRYCAVLAMGGIYSDVGFRCVADLRPLISEAGGGRLFQRPPPRGNIINGFFSFGSPGHDLLQLTLEIATANIERRLVHNVYWVTGPAILTVLLRLHRLGSFDAVIAEFADSPGGQVVPAYCEAIDDIARVDPAFGQVAVLPLDERSVFVSSLGHRLPYQLTDTDWRMAGDRIYREYRHSDAFQAR